MAVIMNGREYRKRDGSDPTTKLRYGGIGTGATATGGQTGTPITAPTTTGTTGTTGYVPGQGVSDAQKAMEAAQAKMPGEYVPGQSVTDAKNKRDEIEAAKPGEYTPGESVTAAEKKLADVEAGKPGAYQQSAAVTAAQQALDAINNSKPQGYESKYGTALDGILNQIQNPQQFKYSFDGDELFKSYADLYTQKGKQASLDAMGQAAGLTGGYGNSYAQQVGNQAYDQYLLSLYDKGMDLRDRAYQQYVDQRADLYNQYNTLGSADDRDYGRYRDTVGDWKDDRSYATDRYDTERDFDYGQHRDTVGDWQKDRDYTAGRYDTERTFDYGKYRDTVGDWKDDRNYYSDQYDTERTFDYGKYSDDYDRAFKDRDYYAGRYENERDFDYGKYTDTRDFDWKKETDQRDFDWKKETDQRDFDEGVREFDETQKENARQFNESLDWDKMDANQKMAASWVSDILANGQMPSAELLMAAGLSEEDAQKLIAQLTGGGSGGGGNSGTGKTYYRDEHNNLYEYDKDGNLKLVDEKTIPKKNDVIDDSKMYSAEPYVAWTDAKTDTPAVGKLNVKNDKSKTGTTLSVSDLINLNNKNKNDKVKK